MENRNTRVCHFTSAHDAYDDRIYLKECISLQNAGYDVCLAAKGKSAVDEGIMIEPVKDMDAILILAGEHVTRKVEESLSENMSGKQEKQKIKVRFIGKIGRKEVNELYSRSGAGMVLYQPLANHFESRPIKMFEYMAAGLPFVASNFLLWKRIVEENACGICVDSQNVQAVREACRKLVADPEMGQRMGKAGRKAVESKYNWSVEEQKLISLYKDLLDIERDSYVD